MSEVEQIKQQLNIVEVIGEYVELKRKGKNYVGRSPFQSEKTPSFVVSPEKQIFKDFSSGAGGDVIKFTELIEKIDFRAAITFLIEKYELNIVTTKSKSQAKNSQAFEILTKVNQFYQFNLFNTKSGFNALAYLKKRNLSEETIKKFELGLSFESGLLEFFEHNKLNLSEALKINLLGINSEKETFYDLFTKRIMIPIKNPAGQVIGFGSRVYLPNDNRAKYINSSDSYIFDKSNTLFNYDQILQNKIYNQPIIIVEGYMDVIQLVNNNINNCVAIMGTSLTIKQVELLKRITKSVIILFDSDKAGQNSAQKAIQLFSEHGIIAKNCILGENLDPDEYINKYGVEKFNRIIENLLEKTQINQIKKISKQVNPKPNEVNKANEIFPKYSLKSLTNLKEEKQFRLIEVEVILYIFAFPHQFLKIKKLLDELTFFVLNPDLLEIYLELKTLFKNNELPPQNLINEYQINYEQKLQAIFPSKTQVEVIKQKLKDPRFASQDLPRDLIRDIKTTYKSYQVLIDYNQVNQEINQTDGIARVRLKNKQKQLKNQIIELERNLQEDTNE